MRRSDIDNDYTDNTAKVAGYITVAAILTLVVIRIAFEQK